MNCSAVASPEVDGTDFKHTPWKERSSVIFLGHATCGTPERRNAGWLKVPVSCGCSTRKSACVLEWRSGVSSSAHVESGSASGRAVRATPANPHAPAQVPFTLDDGVIDEMERCVDLGTRLRTICGGRLSPRRGRSIKRMSPASRSAG
jgi:hypothetical protein